MRPDDVSGDADEEPLADDTATVICPYCGEAVDLGLDPGGGAVQDYIEDCAVCCQPWHVHVHWRRSGHADVRVEAADD